MACSLLSSAHTSIWQTALPVSCTRHTARPGHPDLPGRTSAAAGVMLQNARLSEGSRRNAVDSRTQPSINSSDAGRLLKVRVDSGVGKWLADSDVWPQCRTGDAP